MGGSVLLHANNGIKIKFSKTNFELCESLLSINTGKTKYMFLALSLDLPNILKDRVMLRNEEDKL